MAKEFWVPCALAVISQTLACAGAGSAGKGPVPPPKDPTDGMEMVHVKGGCYPMGSSVDGVGPEEKPAHEVCVDDFDIGKYEVSQGQWKAVMGSNPSHHAFGDEYPVENVSWDDVQEYITTLNARSRGEGTPPGTYRLPTEAEWEYAARSGGKDEKYAGRSDDPDQVAWTFLNSQGDPPHPEGTRPVGLKAPNGLGLHDMTGNVWEWTNDWYGPTYYSSSPRDNPTGPSSGDRRVTRGGSYIVMPFDMRTSYRNFLPPDYRSPSRGFRLVRGAPIRAPSAKPALPAEGEIAVRAAPSRLFKEPSAGMEMVFVQGGCFQMGNARHGEGEGDDIAALDGRPVHEVCVDDFYIGKYEVTLGQWRSVTGSDPSLPRAETCVREDCPVTNVSWSGVELFVSKLNAGDVGSTYRLPTEAEWEYAARSGGGSDRYSGGNDVESVSWYAGTSGYRDEAQVPIVHPVGTRAPNGLGIHDMSGNVHELTGDWFDPDYYSSSPRNNPKGPAVPPPSTPVTDAQRVRRGGCATGQPSNSRTTRRMFWSGPIVSVGLRLVRVPSSSPSPP